MRSNLHDLTVSLLVAAFALGCNTNGSGLNSGGPGDGSGGSGGTIPPGGSGGHAGGAPGSGGRSVECTGPMPPCALPICEPGYVISNPPCSCGVCVPAAGTSGGDNVPPATGGAAGAKGVGGASTGGSTGSGGKKGGGTSGSGGAGGSSTICVAVPCVAPVCADGSTPQASNTCDCSGPCGCPCGCWTCPSKNPPDAGAKKDAKAAPDAPIICPAIACFLPNCAYGTQPSPEPCGCPVCKPAPIDGGGIVGGKDGAVCPPVACPMIACLAGTTPNPLDPCGCPVCAPYSLPATN